MEFTDAGSYPRREVAIDQCRRRRILSRSIHMKRPIIAVLLATAVTLPAFAALKQGDAAPEFAAQASLARKTFPFSLSDATRHWPVVVLFYPAAFTRGCNVPGHAIATTVGQV